MFNNIGSKIKGLAKVITWIGIIASVIAGIGQMVMASNIYGGGGLALSGILTIVLGSLAAWVSSFLVYGFGELVENSAAVAAKLNNRP